MSIPTISIDDNQVDFGNIWVHMQSAENQPAVPYRMSVPLALVHEIFDPHSTRPASTGWQEHIQNHVDEYGTFIFGGYLESMMKHAGTNLKGYLWVIATLEKVVESEELVELYGMAIPFDRDRGIPVLKRMR